jgi:hypothetical protein
MDGAVARIAGLGRNTHTPIVMGGTCTTVAPSRQLPTGSFARRPQHLRWQHFRGPDGDVCELDVS